MPPNINVLMRTQLDMNDLQRSIGQLRQQVGAGLSGIKLDFDVSRSGTQALARVQYELRGTTEAARTAGASLSGLDRTLSRVVAGTVGLGAALSGLRSGVAAAVELDSALNRLARIDAAARVQQVRAEVSGLSRDLGVSSTDLGRSAVALRQVGAASGDLAAGLKTVGQASHVFGSVEEATRATTAVMRAFRADVAETREALGSMAALSKTSGASVDDLSKAIEASGSAWKRAGRSARE